MRFPFFCYFFCVFLREARHFEATGWSDGIHVFEIVQHKTSQVGDSA